MTAKEIIEFIKKSLKGPLAKANLSARYVGAIGHESRSPDEQSRLEYWGHSMPMHRKISNSLSAQQEANKTVEDFWHQMILAWHQTNLYDVRSIILVWLSHKKQKPLRQKFSKDLFNLAKTIDNWALSDGLSGMLSELIEENPKMIRTLKKWNANKNPWLRRQSLVSLYYYARFRKKPIPAKVSLSLVQNLLTDTHFYVQRGVGWTLREIDLISPDSQRNFVEKHLHKISAVAWFAATERYSEKDRKRLVLKRTVYRKRIRIAQ